MLGDKCIIHMPDLTNIDWDKPKTKSEIEQYEKYVQSLPLTSFTGIIIRDKKKNSDLVLVETDIPFMPRKFGNRTKILCKEEDVILV